jgi:hypothetical protein
MGKYVLLILLACLIFTTHSFSQAKVKGSVMGMIVDTAGKQSLASATVSVAPKGDSTPTAIQFVVTNKQGSFMVRNLGAGDYRLVVSFEGYAPVLKNFTISAAAPIVDLATIHMQKASTELEAAIVVRPPMGVKGDTVEYNAAMYTTKPNAVAEDLLKKFPGIQVDASGTITAQGETVQRVLVNGKRFFGDDPKQATRNLPPDVIEKIQVFDDLDDQSKFSGFDNGNRVKTINITTKKADRRGYFGRTVMGAGTNEDYDESINMHRFDNDQQISLLGQANDINKQNFTIQDVLGSSGGRRGGGGPPPASSQTAAGVTTVWAAGANYKDSWGPKTDIYGSYFYNFQHVASSQNSQSVRDLTATTGDTSTSGSLSFGRNWNQRVNLNLEQKFDSNNSLVFRPNITFQTSTPNGSSNSFQVDQNGAAINSINSYNSSTNTGYNVNGSNLTFRHKFPRNFQTLSLDVNGTANVNNGGGYNFSRTNFNQLDSSFTINQYYNDSLHSYTISPTLSFTQPVGKNEIVELNYNYTHTSTNTINNTFDFVDSAHEYTNFDSLFSNSYKFTSNASRISLNYRIQNAKFNLNIGSGLQFTDFKSVNTTKDITVAPTTYVNFTPTLNFQYSFSKTQRLRLFYQGRTGTPSASQLQPLTTTSDDVSFVTGNPDLRPQFTHSLRMLYSSFDPTSQNVIFATINASTTVNDIQSAVSYIYKNGKATGGQNTTYVNLNGTYNVGGFFNYGFSLPKPKSNLNFITNINYSQSQTLVDPFDSTGASPVYEHSYTHNTLLGETVSFTTNIKKNFDMNFSYGANYTIARNSLQPNQNLNYFSQKISTEITAYTNNGWLIAANFDYLYTNNHSPGFNASVPLLSPSIAKSIFKKKNGEIRLTTFDLLNSNTSVSKSVSLTGYSESRTSTLQRYLMLTFTWNLNNFAGAQQRRMPGMFPGMFRGGGDRRGGGGPPGGGRPGGGFGGGGD